MNKNKKQTFILILLLLTTSLLFAEDGWIVSAPYLDLFYPNIEFIGYSQNVIPANDGGYILQASVHCFEPAPSHCYIGTSSLFYKYNDAGEMEWRKHLYDLNDYDEFNNTFASNGQDRYYTTFNSGNSLFILDNQCEIDTIRNYWIEDSLSIRIYSMKAVEDGLILVGTERISEPYMPDKAFIMKTDFDGNIEFYNCLENSYKFTSVIPTSDNGYLASGKTVSVVNYTLAKFNSVGDTLWTKRDVPYPYRSMCEINETYYVFNGYYLDLYNTYGDLINTYVVDLGPGTILHMFLANDNNLFVLKDSDSEEFFKITNTGEVLWGRDYVGNYSEWNIGEPGRGQNSLIENESGSIIYCGTYLYPQSPEFLLIKTNAEGYVDTNDQIVNYTTLNSKSYPNPVFLSGSKRSRKTTISFTLDNPAYIDLKIYNLKGQMVKSLLQEQKDTGEHSVNWNVSEKSSGVYFYRLKMNDNSETGKIMVVK